MVDRHSKDEPDYLKSLLILAQVSGFLILLIPVPYLASKFFGEGAGVLAFFCGLGLSFVVAKLLQTKADKITTEVEVHPALKRVVLWAHKARDYFFGLLGLGVAFVFILGLASVFFGWVEKKSEGVTGIDDSAGKINFVASKVLPFRYCPFGTEKVGSAPDPTLQRDSKYEKWCHYRDADGNYVKHGPYEMWHENGQKATEGYYWNGNPIAHWYFWKSDGVKYYDRDYGKNSG